MVVPACLSMQAAACEPLKRNHTNSKHRKLRPIGNVAQELFSPMFLLPIRAEVNSQVAAISLLLHAP